MRSGIQNNAHIQEGLQGARLGVGETPVFKLTHPDFKRVFYNGFDTLLYFTFRHILSLIHARCRTAASLKCRH